MHYGSFNLRRLFRKTACILAMNIRKMGCKKILGSATLIVVVGIVSIMYFCGSNFCTIDPVIKQSNSVTAIPKSDLETYKIGMLPTNTFSNKEIDHEYKLKLEKKDVLVFLHMQKTGGTTLGHHLVKDLEKTCKCYKKKKRCDCLTSADTIWLFSRYSTGWICGLHADWTELKSCVEEAMDKKEDKKRPRKYHYITILRDPVKRFLSEWKHVQRGATWKTSTLACNGRGPTPDELPVCYNGSDWEEVTLNEFMQCDSNLAINRQTRMLANLTKINCYNKTGMNADTRDQIMLESAKENLKNMAYFGLTEFQKYTQNLFEHTFNLYFKNDFSQLKLTHVAKTKIDDGMRAKIQELNKLDIQLYQYAKDLFLQRVREMKEDEKDYSPMLGQDPDPVEVDDSVNIGDDEQDFDDEEQEK